MLRSLDIRDMLIIDRLELEFQPGLNVLTGETGAGKSILLDSLGFVLGWRGRAELVRKGAAQGEVLAEFDLQDFADYPASGLSYGHQRKVEMARAMAAEPDFVLLDEPSAGMNDVESDALAEIFQRLAANGKGVLLIEHNVRFVAKMCSYIYVLDGGRLISEGTPDDVLKDPAVISAYLGDQHHA